MSNHRISSSASAPNACSAPLTAASAFVVHLTARGAEAPGLVQGRIEHVVSGRSAHFATEAELIGFMQQTLQHESEPELRG
jgi:hypothetical protein